MFSFDWYLFDILPDIIFCGTNNYLLRTNYQNQGEEEERVVVFFLFFNIL